MPEDTSKVPEGFEGNLTPDQEATLEEFRQKVKSSSFLMEHIKYNPLHTPFLLRFLRARNFDINKSMALIEKYANFIKEHDVWNTTIDDVMDVADNPVIKWMGKDLDGRSTFLIQPGLHVPGEINYDVLPRALASVLFLATQESTDDKTTLCLVLHYKDWGLGNIDTKLDRILLPTAQDLAPEQLGKAFFVQPPWYFSTAWAVVKHFIHEQTQEKFEFLSSNPIERLKERFDEDTLVEDLGGKKDKAETIDTFLRARMEKNETLLEAMKKRAKEFGHELAEDDE